MKTKRVRAIGLIGWAAVIGGWALVSVPAEGRGKKTAPQCRNGAARKCHGECGSGVSRCVRGRWQRCAPTNPKPEVCDGKDNNCDGNIDEGLSRACQSACGNGQQQCIQGDWGQCSAPTPSPEVCDGKDNDCDGQIDEGASCPGGRCQNGQCVRKPINGERPNERAQSN